MQPIKKTETFDYYVDYKGEILDNNNKYIYCIFHIDQRLYLDHKDGFIKCRSCNLKYGDINNE